MAIQVGPDTFSKVMWCQHCNLLYGRAEVDAALQINVTNLIKNREVNVLPKRFRHFYQHISATNL